ncbi:MAG: NAD(P)-binding domain-containing protein [Deltaproteobacteria bacterium]|nr:NAD(P)-binding domain-containing protein [Deltaproteobacteria bacterium]
MTSIGILGGGPWGLALARAARRAGATVTLCTRREHGDKLGGMTVTAELGELAQSSRLLLMAVPSNRVRSIARELGDHLDGAHLLVHGIRGLSGDELAPISQILREETPARRLGALGGPVQADELNRGQPSAMVVASEFPDVTRAVRAALNSKWLQVHGTGDLCGLEWASAMVGCLSIGVGFAQARADVSPGLMAALISRAVDEAAGIAMAAGASERTFYGLGGYGDLIASMASPDRPDVVLGRVLAGGASLEQAREEARLRVEAIELVPRAMRFARRQGVACDIFAALEGIITGASQPEDIVSALFAA